MTFLGPDERRRMAVLNLYVEEHHKKALQALSKATGRSMSELVREAIEMLIGARR